jgi:hypothetical protein
MTSHVVKLSEINTLEESLNLWHTTLPLRGLPIDKFATNNSLSGDLASKIDTRLMTDKNSDNRTTTSDYVSEGESH